MKEEILYLLDNNKAFTVKEISEMLHIDNENETRKILEELCDTLDLVKTKKNRYTLFEKGTLKKGTISIAKGGYGFVDFGGKKDAFIHSNDLNGAMNGDLVSIEITSEIGDKIDAKVVKIASNQDRSLVGEVVNKRKATYILLDNNKHNIKVVLNGRNHGYVDGTKVMVELGNKIDNETYTADVVEVLGHKNDPGIDLLSIVRNYKIDTEFPEEVLNEIENIPDELTEDVINDKIAMGARDLRDERIFTIDGDDTKDIDDAASIKILPNGNYKLGIHIADVSDYVKCGSALWNDATTRGTSVYLPGSSIPMLPRKLSNGICSLNPDVDRLALTFDMEIDNTGKVVAFDTYESIIRSRKQMTYKNVNSILEDDIIPEGYENYVSDLKTMNTLAHLLRKKKIRRGFIDFAINENKIEVDENGKPLNVILRTRGEAEKLIEDFMVETGEQASNYLDENGYKDDHVYRVHGLPNEEKISNLKAFLSSMNYKTKYLEDLNPISLQRLLDEMKDKKEYLIIAREILRCMQKAIYSTNNIGHFALASTSTCQVTSPIRRSGDLINHVLIKENIYKKASGLNNKKELARLSSIASAKERNADSCEMDADKMKMAEYMEKHIGETFEGMITGIIRIGMFVELPNLIEGFVSMDTLTDDNYKYDREKNCLVGRTSNKKYRLGDRVTVKVINASKGNHSVDFEIDGLENKKLKKITIQK